jgi:aminoglycoside phosphotransferase (APT) family kinase protein
MPWEAVPEEVRTAVEEGVCARVIDSHSQPGGFSPGAAARLRLEDGRRVFVKAAGTSPNPETPEFHRREGRIAAALPPGAPAPRLLLTHDDGDWVALVFEDVDGREPTLPWREDELERVLAAVADLSAALTPAPLAAPPLAERFGEQFRGWRTFVAEGAAVAESWAANRVDLLAGLEAQWAEASVGETLLHADIRADNILLAEQRVVFVDWPHACVGAPWVDLLAMLPSVAMQGGPKPWTVFGGHPLARGAPPELVDAVLAAVAGFFVQRATLPPPPGLPTLREFQRAQGVEALAWLRRRLGEP